MARKKRPLVLVVDDEALFRSSLAEALSEPGSGFEILTAANGGQALELLERRRVDLLVTDLHMPVLDGFGLLREYMRLQPESPAVVLTAYGSPQIEEDLKLQGGISYLEKPVEIVELSQRIRELVRPRAKSHIEGITLFGFLQLVEVERKSCTLTIHSEDRVARLYFDQGDLVHAELDGSEGEEAVLKLGDWTLPEIDIEYTCLARTRTVHSRLTELLLEAARLADERGLERAAEPHRADNEAGGAFTAERGRAWIQAAERLLGADRLPAIAVGVRLADGSLTMLRGPETASDWSTALQGVTDAAIRMSNQERRATCEVITDRIGIGVVWSDGEAIVLADALPAKNSSVWFRSQLGTLTRVAWEAIPATKGERDGKDR